jgi:hypothetical protein
VLRPVTVHLRQDLSNPQALEEDFSPRRNGINISKSRPGSYGPLRRLQMQRLY